MVVTNKNNNHTPTKDLDNFLKILKKSIDEN